MPKRNSNLNKEIDAGKFFLFIFYMIFALGIIVLFIWFYNNVYKPEERSYIKAARYSYKIFIDEISQDKIKQYIKDDNTFLDNEFCFDIARKYSKTKSGSCNNFNPLIPVENFIFKGKKISVLGLEKPAFMHGSSLVKDIIIDKNSENKGENQVGTDRAILRIYLSGRNAGIITPVNCNKKDEEEYGLKTSIYCIGSSGENFLSTNKPLGYDIEQTNTETGEIRTVGKNIPFLRADCSAFDGEITDPGEYCSDKMFYTLRACEDEYTCKIILTKY